MYSPTPMSSKMALTGSYRRRSSSNPSMRFASTVSAPASCSAYAAILLARPMPRPSCWRYMIMPPRCALRPYNGVVRGSHSSRAKNFRVAQASCTRTATGASTPSESPEVDACSSNPETGASHMSATGSIGADRAAGALRACTPGRENHQSQWAVSFRDEGRRRVAARAGRFPASRGCFATLSPAASAVAGHALPERGDRYRCAHARLATHTAARSCLSIRRKRFPRPPRPCPLSCKYIVTYMFLKY